MQVRFDDALDAQAMLGRVIEIDVHVAAGIDHYRASGSFVADQIRRVRQAGQVMLRENHLAPPCSGCPKRSSQTSDLCCPGAFQRTTARTVGRPHLTLESRVTM